MAMAALAIPAVISAGAAAAAAAPVATAVGAASLLGSGISAYGQYQGAQSQAAGYQNSANNALSSIPGSIMAASSTTLAAKEANYAADDAKRAADYQLVIGENAFRKSLVDADNARAAGQVNAANAAREKRLALSAVQARGAASGAGPALDIAGSIGAQGEFNKLYALYDAENTARSIYDNGVAAKWNAQNSAYQMMQQRRSMIAQGFSYQNQAQSYTNQIPSALTSSNNYNAAASRVMGQAPLAAAGTLLGGVGSAVTSYRNAGGNFG